MKVFIGSVFILIIFMALLWTISSNFFESIGGFISKKIKKFKHKSSEENTHE